MKIALAMIVKGDDTEAVLLDRCLSNIVKHVDGIFITRTNLPGEKPNAAVAAVAKKFKAHLSDFEWCFDFSAARNFNFQQVPQEYTYIMWTDADDMWRGLEKLKPTLADHPHMDGFAFWYLYDWDEWRKPTVVHKKTMIVKNDKSTTWKGILHEDIHSDRMFETMLIEGIERLHLTNGDRAQQNAKRNVEIAEKMAKALPNDPRSDFNLANSYIGVARYDDAKRAFISFLEETESDEERYIARMRLADIEKHLGNRDECIRQYQLAIGLYPNIPDAYHNLGQAFYDFQNWDKAEDYILQGLVKRPQPDKMIVFNPRDYDYNPMMLLAKVYYQKNRPDLMLPMLEGCLKIYPHDEHLKKLVVDGRGEKKSMEKALLKIRKLQTITDKAKLKKALDALPVDIASHPLISALRNTNFIKKESSGRELVIYCGNTVHQWNPELFKTVGVGGSEEAVIHLAEQYAKLGWDVVVYNNCGHKRVVTNDVTYRPYWEWNYRDRVDVTILWRTCKPLDGDINCERILIDLHDVFPESEFSEKRMAKIHKIMVKTQFHRSLLPNIPDDKICVIPNGMDLSQLRTGVKKDPYLVLNTSSPERSMDVVPALFKRVKKQVPKAKMIWVYGWDLFKTTHASDSKKLKWMDDTIAAMKDAGIESRGKVSQAEVGKLYQQAAILAYPSEFAEIDCISVKKAQAARCWPVATDFGALDESITFGAKVHSKKTKDDWNKPFQFHFGLEDKDGQEQWVADAVALLKDGLEADKKEHELWCSQFAWSSIAARWNDIILA